MTDLTAPPRVTLRHLFRQGLFWIAALFLAAGLLFGTITWFVSADARLLAAEGVDTTGTIIGRDERQRRNSSGSTRTTYYLVVSFQTASGATAQTWLEVPRSRHEAAVTGQPVALRHAASDPGVTEWQDGDTARLAGWLTLFVAGMGLAGLVSLGAALRALASMRRAAQGERRAAQVVAHHRVGKARARTYSMEWNDGAAKGRTSARRADTLPPVGATITVFLDPKNGKGWWDGEF